MKSATDFRPALLALTLGCAALASPAAAACDIAECNPQVCDPWRPAWTINDFPAHQTDTTTAQRDALGDIARHVADSQDDADPLVCLRLIGHASSFRGIGADEYDRRAMVRGETVAEMLTATLETHGLTSFTVARGDIDNDDAFCGEVLGSDITLIFDGRGNACPLVDNMVNSSSGTARANRAVNRRVSIYALRAMAPIERPDAPAGPSLCNEPRAICINRHGTAVEGKACWTPGNFWENPDDLRDEVRRGEADLICGEM
ncbi:hypothetical protein MWU52_14835 [Jannaschia sp. S6380]|uniref:hypothetical protein n=1 Tax=Jannaschia sp. S6380 TaxID=2926408 RepID=UPI001FF42898|nr:hypothetical protein [Jannaschia sp. S6380]MCK0168833.1 hypothetical protein [Jannaschia sp. S6380]